MADQLYLSLWFPNFRLQALPAALTGVLRQFAVIAKDGNADADLGKIVAASAYPIDWTESTSPTSASTRTRTSGLDPERLPNSTNRPRPRRRRSKVPSSKPPRSSTTTAPMSSSWNGCFGEPQKRLLAKAGGRLNQRGCASAVSARTSDSGSYG